MKLLKYDWIECTTVAQSCRFNQIITIVKNMARISGIDLPRNKRGEIGLTYIYRYRQIYCTTYFN